MTPFRPFAANVTWAAAIGGIAYGLFFVIVGNQGAAAVLLLVGEILTALLLSGSPDRSRSCTSRGPDWLP